MGQNQDKKWFIKFIVSLIVSIAGIILVTVIVDPYFHYHAPIEGISYRLYEERYINDGIGRQFDYDTIITGTSMTQNFKPSEWDAMTDSRTVKIPFSGGSFIEIGNNLRRAISYNKNLKTVIWGIDYNCFLRKYDYDGYGMYPEYLYDNNIWNDTSYVLNKSILYHGTIFNIFNTLSNEKSTTMDEYASWDYGRGMEAILRSYERREDILPMEPELTTEEREMVIENIQKNLVELANENPDITFYFFYTPYSIVYWDKEYREGTMLKQFEAEEIATSMLLQCPNIKLYNFFDKYDIICNVENYKDKEHYIAEVNSCILKWMYEGNGLVDELSYMEQIEKNREFYRNYPYDDLFAE